jgi:hypothetical protein
MLDGKVMGTASLSVVLRECRTCSPVSLAQKPLIEQTQICRLWSFDLVRAWLLGIAAVALEPLLNAEHAVMISCGSHSSPRPAQLEREVAFHALRQVCGDRNVQILADPHRLRHRRLRRYGPTLRNPRGKPEKVCDAKLNKGSRSNHQKPSSAVMSPTIARQTSPGPYKHGSSYQSMMICSLLSFWKVSAHPDLTL